MTRNLSSSPPEISKGPEVQTDDHQFDVFLSYSRKDEEFGKKLEEALENFRLPKNIKTSLISRNRLSVFRDKNDLVPTDTDYYQTIAGYLKRSGNLIVICSPNARRSRYVNQEIAAFLESHEPKSIIPILLSGRPNNESEANPDEHAFPEALCSALQMPLALDFTEFEPRNKVHRGRYRDSWYTLLAKIFGAERAEIERVDAKRQARRRAIFAAVSVAIIALLSVALVFAIISRREAVKQKQTAEAERDRARRLLYASNMNLAQRSFESGNVALGKELLESYLPAKQSGQEDLRGFEWYYLWRLYNQQLATFDATDDIAFSRDGARFATMTADAVKIWDAASLRETARFKLSTQDLANDLTRDPDYVFSSIEFSPDGRTLAVGDYERVRLLDTGSGSFRDVPAMRSDKPQDEHVGGGTPRFSPDGKLLAIIYTCDLVGVYDAHSLKQIAKLGKGMAAESCTDFVAFSPNGKILAYGDGFSVSLWDVSTQTDLRGPEVEAGQADSVGQIEAIAFSSDGKLLAIGDRSKELVLWNISTRKVLARLKAHDDWVTATAFSADGKTLYSGSADQTVKIWDFSSYQGDGRISPEKVKVLATLKGHTGLIRSINCAPTPLKITATAGADRTIKLWGEGAGREFDSVEGVESVPPGASFYTKYSDEGVRTLFDLRGGGPMLAGTEIMTFSPDGKTFVTGALRSENNVHVIKLFNANPRQEVATLSVSVDSQLTFSPDGKLFTAIGSDGKSVVLWDTVGRKELTSIRSDSELSSYIVSPDGKVIVTVDKDRKRVRSWDVASQRQLAMFDIRKTPDVAKSEDAMEWNAQKALSPDGKLFAFSSSNEVRLWQTDLSQEPVVLGRQEATVNALAFSSDGKRIAAGNVNGVVKVWDADTRAELSAFKGHKVEVKVLAFSPDGKTLASGGGDGTVKLYNMVAMRELITLTHEPSATSEFHALQGGEDSVSSLFFSADGHSLITLSNNHILRIWRGAP